MSILDQEIHEQPEVLSRMLAVETENISELVKDLRKDFHYVVIAARGTSDNAARYAQYLFGAHNQLPVALATPSLYTLYKKPPRMDGALLIGISQSGQSPDIVAVIEEGKRQGRPTLAITNDSNSPLARAAGNVIQLHAGKEIATAATKTYTASLGAMALFSAILRDDQECLNELNRLPEAMQVCLSSIKQSLTRLERYRYMDHCVVVGRGYNYSTAFEIALKIKELTLIITEPYSSADLRHGPIAMLRDGFPVMVIAPTSSVSADIEELIDDLQVRGAELLIVSDQEKLLRKAQMPLPLPLGIPEWLTPMIAVLPGQLFGYTLAVAKGLNPDQPPGITKVTETL